MPTKEEILTERTHKGLEVGPRVCYTLADGAENGTEAHRQSKLIAVLVEKLCEKGVLRDPVDVDDMLMQVAYM